MKRYIRYSFSIFFLIILFSFFILNYSNFRENIITKINSEKDLKELLSVCEDNYNNNFYGKMTLVDINGAYRRILGKTIVGDVIRAKDSLTLESEIVYNIDNFKDDIEYTKMILDYANLSEIETLYVQHPTKINTFLNELPYGKGKNAVNADEYWLNEINKDGYDTLNLCEEKYKANKFYKTDHHWTNESALNAANAILNALNIETDICKKENYDNDVYKNCFLGSAGIRVGKHYVGKDDFQIFIPKFKTDLEYKHIIDNKITFESTGSFVECFIDFAKISDKNYNNKYNAFLNGGYVENIIFNQSCNNNKKALIISDSFARPMTQYLSLAFSETRYLDPQVGRFNNSCIEYIEQYNPDYLIIMYSWNYEDKMIKQDMALYG